MIWIFHQTVHILIVHNEALKTGDTKFVRAGIVLQSGWGGNTRERDQTIREASHIRFKALDCYSGPQNATHGLHSKMFISKEVDG